MPRLQSILERFASIFAISGKSFDIPASKSRPVRGVRAAARGIGAFMSGKGARMPFDRAKTSGMGKPMPADPAFTTGMCAPTPFDHWFMSGTGARMPLDCGSTGGVGAGMPVGRAFRADVGAGAPLDHELMGGVPARVDVVGAGWVMWLRARSGPSLTPPEP